MKRAKDWNGDLTIFLKDYDYQPDLTRKLDALAVTPFDQAVVNEIVLWKVNRYAPLQTDALDALNELAQAKPKTHRQTAAQVAQLLDQSGVDLPMASTLLRFQNPKVFQIIDRHAYRAVTGDDYPLYSASGVQRKIDVYFQYLDDLFALADTKSVPFHELDRILYIFDKQQNGKL